MPQWTVEGANKATGVETTLLVEAPTDAAARDVASAQGLAVAAVMPSDQHQTIQSHAIQHPLHYQTGREPLRTTGLLARYLTSGFLARTLLVIAAFFYMAALAQVVHSILIFTGPAGTSFGRGLDGLFRVLTSLTQAAMTALWGGGVHLVAVFVPVLFDRLSVSSSPPKR